MSSKDDIQLPDVQLDVKSNEELLAQVIEWSRQVSKRMKAMQQEIDKLNEWVYPK